MSGPNALAQLAALTDRCHNCAGSGLLDEASPALGPCVGRACGGTGTVPRIPGLQKVCLGFITSGPQHTTICSCGGLGYTLVSEAEALLVLVEYCLSQQITFEFLGWREATGETRCIVNVDLRTESQGRPAEALAAALLKARGEA